MAGISLGKGMMTMSVLIDQVDMGYCEASKIR